MDNLVLVIFILFEKIRKIPAANEAANVLNILKKKKKEITFHVAETISKSKSCQISINAGCLVSPALLWVD